MLYHLALELRHYFFAFNVFKYITFRSLLAIILAFVLVLVITPIFTRKMKAVQRLFKGYVREYTPEGHVIKRYVPTMGGFVILLSILVSSLLLMRLDLIYFWIITFCMVGFALIGFLDDYVKLKNKKGISAKLKFSLQMVVATVTALFIYFFTDVGTKLYFPVFKNLQVDLGLFYIPFCVFVIVATSNAVNLTDGLDGLAIGPVMTTAGALGVVSYAVGHATLSKYLNIPYVPYAGDLTVLCFAIVGAGLGFLWFNAYPAQLFMGDVGALSLGATLGVIAVVSKSELLLPIAGGVFVFETLSVILQVAYFKLTKGKRLFKMAPFHHHLELSGIPEPKIVVRMWIISFLLAVLTVATLKVR
ncbi:phospho-N-acetylmuramoyl-pentapeptide-transferase [Thermocrinis minervae]|uniref:Phospho-N-acetylmuramoyl-pentapeptide-transferase n=1 Tax=Thermocrinis minervae TaxID=381751 RepID=A0A1M6S6B7_9AQUI|nr:phospho-N-acetylmuramoyl-pentapeptide-transferase [Thermocrinis minervae]SHK40235.1 Phospho-N-acetylmuramoyl-pentapeptide-transferase [Thermocrinis minervae]